MKKLLMSLFLISLVMLGCCSAAEEGQTTNFYTVTYDNNGHGSAPSMQSKEPGKDLQLNIWPPDEDFLIFVGWAESPDATAPDYLPGDMYVKDQNVTLYAIWREPYALGQISGDSSFSIPPLGCDESYLSFSVSESGTYRFSTTGTYYNPFSHGSSPGILTKGNYGYSSATWGDFIDDEHNYTIGFTVTATLQTGTTYYLRYTDSGTQLHLLALPQYSDPNPYTASSAVPRSVSIIADGAFEGCGFESFQVPAGTTSIGARAFANCPNLRKVVISSVDVAIADDAFAGCTDLLIVAPKNSTAHQYAKAHGLEFRALP